MLNYLKRLDVDLMGYAPLGSNSFPHRGTMINILEDKTIRSLSEKYNSTPA